VALCIHLHLSAVAQSGEDEAVPQHAREVANALGRLVDFLNDNIIDPDDDLVLGGDLDIGGDLTVQGDQTCYGTKYCELVFADGVSRKLYCVESPVCHFEDYPRGVLAEGQRSIQLAIDPLFIECCQPGSIVVAGVVAEEPGLGLGARVAQSCVLVTCARAPTVQTELYAHIVGTRRGVTDRFPRAVAGGEP